MLALAHMLPHPAATLTLRPPAVTIAPHATPDATSSPDHARLRHEYTWVPGPQNLRQKKRPRRSAAGVPPFESAERRAYAAVRLPYGNSGTGRTLPPHMNAATFGRRGGSNPPRITIPRTSRRSVPDRSVFFPSILPPESTPQSFGGPSRPTRRAERPRPGALGVLPRISRPRVL